MWCRRSTSPVTEKPTVPAAVAAAARAVLLRRRGDRLWVRAVRAQEPGRLVDANEKQTAQEEEEDDEGEQAQRLLWRAEGTVGERQLLPELRHRWLGLRRHGR